MTFTERSEGQSHCAVMAYISNSSPLACFAPVKKTAPVPRSNAMEPVTPFDGGHCLDRCLLRS